MAISDAYVSEQEFRASIDQISVDDSLINRTYLQAVSRYIDFKLGRKATFNKDDDDTERIYVAPAARGASRQDWAESENPWRYGPQSRVIDIEDLITATSIEVDEGSDGTYSRLLEDTDFELLPRNAAVHGEPYKQISLLASGSLVSWPSGVRVKVTGIHGWPAIPDGIKVATIEIASLLMKKSILATGRIQEMDQVVSSSPEVRAVLMGMMTNFSAGVFF